MSHFRLPGFPRFGDIEALVEQAGVGLILQSQLPQGIRGFHASLGRGPFTIHLGANDWEGGREHTILHEVYEILLEKFHQECPSYDVPAQGVACRRADRFAAEVLMQPKVFSLFALASGLDVVALQRAYRRSYASIVYRLAEVLPDTPFGVLLYRRQEAGGPDQWKHGADATVFGLEAAGVSKAFRQWRSGLVSDRNLGLDSQRGTLPEKGSVACRVITGGRPAVSGLRPVIEIARPVFWRSKLAKVVTVLAPATHKGLLEPQFVHPNVD